MAAVMTPETGETKGIASLESRELRQRGGPNASVWLG
jgi:hypothetical protein